MTMLNRRKLITGLISFVAAPVIVRASSLMPVKVMDSFDPWSAINEMQNKLIFESNPYPLDGKFAALLMQSKLEMFEIAGIGYKDFYDLS